MDEAKGIDVIKEGIRKMKFTEHLKRAEGGKTPKVELTISIDGVAIQEPKGKKILHQFPLHHLSYCADDKSEKKFFSFIAKHPAIPEQHVCFVFVSDKLAEEITLTIGQAFDLAYRRFLETSGRDLEMRRQLMVLQKKVQELEKENTCLKAKLEDCEKSRNGKRFNKKIAAQINNGNLESCQTLTPIPKPPPNCNSRHNSLLNGTVSLLDMEVTPTVGTKLQNLSIDDMDDLDDQDFDPRATEDYNKSSSSSHSLANIQSNAPDHGSSGEIIESNGYHSNDEEKDIFGSEPFNPNPVTTSSKINDPFGMDSFAEKELEDAIGAIDKKLADMRVRLSSLSAYVIYLNVKSFDLTGRFQSWFIVWKR